MYILKNAFRSITRSKGRSVLIGIIVLVIAISACLGLSIRQAAEDAKTTSMEDMTITAQISRDRSKLMKEAQSDDGSFDPSTFKDQMQGKDDLSLDELKTYAKADAVDTFYYTTSVSLNGVESSDDSSASFQPVDTSSDDAASSDADTADSTDTADADNAANGRQGGAYGDWGGDGEAPSDMPGGFKRGGMGTQGDFTAIGYSSDAAMTDFTNGTSKVTDGAMFDEGSKDLNCVISDELATYNSLLVGDSVTVTNPNKEAETYTLKVVGIFKNSQSTVSEGGMMRGFAAANDPANQIYMSYTALSGILSQSEANADTSTDSDSGEETTTAMPGQLSGTYTFASMDDYNAFEDQAKDLGLADDYTVSSSDVSSYEQSLVPLENLSKMAGYFLIVVLAIGAVVLFVINIFNVRERKYEVGVLTAIGMKKHKVALQFIMETCIITIMAIIIGGAAGSAASVPVTNSLLAAQIKSQENTQQETEASFGREAMGGPGGGNAKGEQTSGGHTGGDKAPQAMARNLFGKSGADYISKVTQAADLTVFIRLVVIGILLALIASGASVVFIMRYEPLKILSNRD